jgi:hypothetical protein
VAEHDKDPKAAFEMLSDSVIKLLDKIAEA